MVGLGGDNSTYLLRSWYLTRWNVFVGIFVTQLGVRILLSTERILGSAKNCIVLSFNFFLNNDIDTFIISIDDAVFDICVVIILVDDSLGS